MTETQAKSGTAGASTTPVDEDVADGGTPATGRAAVGRAAVPADGASPRFTRAAGMPPPPDSPEAGRGHGESATALSGGTPNGPLSSPPVAPVAPVASGKASVSAPVTPGVGSGSAGAGAGGFGKAGGTSGISAGHSQYAQGAPATGRVGTGSGSFRTVGAGGTATAPVSGAGAPIGSAAVGAARVNEAVRSARNTVASAAARGPRRARLNLKRIDPWSVMKFAFAVSLVLFIVVIVATSVLYLALDAMGVFQQVNSSLGDLISASGGQEATTFRITAKGVIGTSALVGLVNVVLFTALATLSAFIYNVCADLVGGVELTLAERD
jgi:hypothetical protein